MKLALPGEVAAVTNRCPTRGVAGGSVKLLSEEPLMSLKLDATLGGVASTISQASHSFTPSVRKSTST